MNAEIGATTNLRGIFQRHSEQVGRPAKLDELDDEEVSQMHNDPPSTWRAPSPRSL